MKTIYCGAWDFRRQPVGIRAFSLDEQSGRWESMGSFGTDRCQSILTIAGKFLVSVSELGSTGKVISYFIMKDGTLKQADALPFASTKLSYTVASASGQYVFVSSMGDGTVKMIRVSQDGKLSLSDEWKLTGHSVTPRQNQAKVHSVMISPNGTLLAAANLGADEVELFSVDEKQGRLRLVDSCPVDFGREPRHMAFRPDGKHLYLLTEGGNRLYVYQVINQKLREQAAYENRCEDGEQNSLPADVIVSPDGKFLYTTNRGQNNIVVWKILDSGLLDRVAICDCGGKGPRGIYLSKDGKTMFSANNEDDTVAVLPVDPSTGLLGEVEQILDVPAAGCVRGME